MLGYYADLIPRCFRGCHVERIEVSDLSECDFEPTKNNIFVRSCDEDSFNIYLLFFRGEVGDREFDLARNFLQSDKRSKFRLNHPGITLDLSAVLPICLADGENAKKLRPYCDVIRISEPAEEEKQSFLRRILAEKASVYGISSLTAEEKLAEKLTRYPVDEIETICDTAIREHRMQTLTLTEETVRPYMKSAGAKRAYGFGGSIHEDHE